MRNTRNQAIHEASFRDPSGFLFRKNDMLYRQVNQNYRIDYDHLIESGLYVEMVEAGLLIPHREVEVSPIVPEQAYKIIEPVKVEFISYPYEWSFSQLKDAALVTLCIQKHALEKNMSLKDASAYNIQFHQGNPLLIDTLSFEKYHEGQPWISYRQFCQHFLAPLVLMSYRDCRLGQFSRIHIDGLPLDLTSKLLPWFTKLNFSTLLHIHLHAKSQAKYAHRQIDKFKTNKSLSKRSLLGLIDSLETLIKKQKLKVRKTEWGDYYDEANYNDEAFSFKKQLVYRFSQGTKPNSIWDLGANKGVFSRVASDSKIPTVAFDIDPIAVEKNYIECKARKDKFILPLLLDLTNPSPSIGWMCRERDGLMDRGPVDLVLALALTHHLAISNNLPFEKISEFFRSICRWLILEFVPKSDSQVKRLLATRKDIFHYYNEASFENSFGEHFQIVDKQRIQGTERTLYLLKNKA